MRDGSGNFYIDTVLQNNSPSDNGPHTLTLPVRVDSSGNVNMKQSEVLKFVSRANGQAADLSLPGVSQAFISAGTRVAAEMLEFFNK